MLTIGDKSQNNHLPKDSASIHIIEFTSTLGTITVLFVTIALFFDWMAGFHIATKVFAQTIVNLPTFIALISSCASIFLYKKNIKFQLFGLIPLAVGLITVAGYFTDITFFALFSAVNIKTGIYFVIIGLSLLLSIAKIPHRYHYMQLTILISQVLSLYVFLESIYQFLSSGTVNNALWSSLLFFIMCNSILFSRPNRGFVGLFTADSRSSELARMSFFYFTFLPPILGILLQFEEKFNFLDINGRLALMVIVITLVSLAITWINIRLLYHTEVENFLMKETLRAHNIKLELSATDLSTKVNQLEIAKKEIADKFNNQQTLKELMDNS